MHFGVSSLRQDKTEIAINYNLDIRYLIFKYVSISWIMQRRICVEAVKEEATEEVAEEAAAEDAADTTEEAVDATETEEASKDEK